MKDLLDNLVIVNPGLMECNIKGLDGIMNAGNCFFVNSKNFTKISDRIVIPSFDDCWNWKGNTRRGGNPALTVWSDECNAATTVIPGNLMLNLVRDTIVHNRTTVSTCKNKLCVNPNHLEYTAKYFKDEKVKVVDGDKCEKGHIKTAGTFYAATESDVPRGPGCMICYFNKHELMIRAFGLTPHAFYSLNAEYKKRLVISAKGFLKRVWFKWYKSKLKCTHCGIQDFRVIDFHHVNRNDKVDNVATLVGGNRPFSLIVIEIKKCIPLCRNCHTKEEYRLRGINEDLTATYSFNGKIADKFK